MPMPIPIPIPIPTTTSYNHNMMVTPQFHIASPAAFYGR
jgi:hypothetical protein